MKFTILTLFPDMVLGGLNTSVVGRAVKNDIIEINAVDIRDFSDDKNRRVDDYTYGGGAGMLMQAEPVYRAWESAGGSGARTLYMSPQGKPFSQAMAKEYAKEEHIILLCGHYEGIDERALEAIGAEPVSIGDFVLSGGELASMVIVDAVSRLVPGVLGNEESFEVESFYKGLLEYPQYTRPETWNGKTVPAVLLSGNKKQIESYRSEQSIERTRTRRPDLYKIYQERTEIIHSLKKNKRDFIYFIEYLERDIAEIKFSFFEDNTLCGLVLFLPDSDVTAVLCKNEAAYDRMLKECDFKTGHIEFCGPENLMKRFVDSGKFDISCKVRNAVYTERVRKPVNKFGIIPFPAEQLDLINEYYHMGSRAYILNRINSGNLFAAINSEGSITGFAGLHDDGSMGLLFVLPEFRNSGYAFGLESFLINRELELGHVPFGQIIEGNDESIRLQEKLGLYISEPTTWWLKSSQ